VSTTTAPEDITQATAGQLEEGRGRHRRLRTGITTAVVLAVAVAVVVLLISDPFGSPSGASGAAPDNGDPTSLASVTRGVLSQQIQQSGTLSYAAQADGSPYEVVNEASGTLSALPVSGQVIDQGHVLYRVAGAPVVLLAGSTPAYRPLSEGDSGPDVRELNRDLVALGYATRSELDPGSDYFSSETAYALGRLQDKLGLDETGTLATGQAVFAPAPLRVSNVLATLGTNAQPGAPLLQATSTARQVVVDLDASEQSSVAVGDRAVVTLPDNTTTPGRVSRIGTVASAGGSGSSGSSGSSNATIPVDVTLDHPRVAGTLDQAPVLVQITTGGVRDALIVPVASLLALAGGGYAVETVDQRGAHRLVAVALGAFDDADGLVQVSGSLQAGDRIVVPTI
jgi:hypothetical protein